MPTSYEILEIAPNATAEEIRKAYKKLVVKFHPDKGGDRDQFEKIQQAYEKLTKPDEVAASASSFFTRFTMDHIDINAYIAAIHLEEKNKPPKSESWRVKFLSKNKIFGRYAGRILEMLENVNADPITILNGLFDLYIAPGSMFSLWGHGRGHIPLVLELKELLKKSGAAQPVIDELPVGLVEVFARIDKEPTPLNPQGEFIELFNAFFAIYPLYLALLDNTHKLKKQISLTVFDDILAQTIFRTKTRELIYSTRNVRNLTSADAEVLFFTGELTVAVNTVIHGIKTGRNRLDQYSHMNNLVKLTQQAPANLIENVILPFILAVISDANNVTEFHANPYTILCKTIQTVDPLCVEKHILPTLIASKHIYEDYHFSEMLTEIALRLGKNITEKYIFPIAIQSLEINQEVIRSRNFKTIESILHLIAPQIILEILAPKLIKYLEFNFLAYREVYQVYARLLALERAAVDADKLKWAEILLVLARGFEEDLAEKGYLFTNSYKLVVMSSAAIDATIIPFVMKKIFSPGIKLSETKLDYLNKLSELPEHQLPATIKNIIFKNLYALFTTNVTTEYLKTLQNYLPLCGDAKIFADLFEQLLAKADFTSSRSYDSMIEPLLIDVTKYVEPIILQTKLLPFILSNSSIQKIEKISPLYLILKNALARLDEQYVMQTVFPVFFTRTLNTQEAEAELIIPFVSKLSYSNSVQISLQLIKSIEKHEWYFCAAQFKLLHELCKHHQILATECKPHLAAEQNRQPLSMATSPSH